MKAGDYSFDYQRCSNRFYRTASQGSHIFPLTHRAAIEFPYATVNYLTENKGVTVLLFSEVSHINNAYLKNNLQQISSSQKNLVSKFILDGKAARTWNENIADENLARINMGVSVSLNIDLSHCGSEFHADNFCSKVMKLLIRMLEKWNKITLLIMVRAMAFVALFVSGSVYFGFYTIFAV